MTTPFIRTRIATALAGLALALAAGQAPGSGFALQENNGSGLGNAYAGGAAVAEDAGTLWANPAGMSRIGTRQVAAALHLIQPSFKFSNNGNSLNALNQPLGDNGGDAGSLNIVPNLYFVMPINNQWSFGIGVNAPFGLVTEYGGGFIGRYQAIKSDVKTINVNPALSWKVTDSITIGAGASYQQIDATLTNYVNYSAAIASAAPQFVAAGAITSAQAASIVAQTAGLNTTASVEGDDYSWGWNIGVLFQFDKNNRFGVSYRSDIDYTVAGSVTFVNPALPTLIPSALQPAAQAIANAVNASALLANGDVTGKLKVPGMANISWFGKVSDHWDLMADAQWTNWSTLQDLTFVRANGVILQSVPYQWKDTWRFSLGANYHYDDRLLFRVGTAYDQTPVPDENRTPRLPDANKYWIAFGGQYKVTPTLALDLGFVYSWFQSASVNQISKSPLSVAQYGYLSGDYDNTGWIVSGQVTWSF